MKYLLIPALLISAPILVLCTNHLSSTILSQQLKNNTNQFIEGLENSLENNLTTTHHMQPKQTETSSLQKIISKTAKILLVLALSLAIGFIIKFFFIPTHLYLKSAKNEHETNQQIQYLQTLKELQEDTIATIDNISSLQNEIKLDLQKDQKSITQNLYQYELDKQKELSSIWNTLSEMNDINNQLSLILESEEMGNLQKSFRSSMENQKNRTPLSDTSQNSYLAYLSKISDFFSIKTLSKMKNLFTLQNATNLLSKGKTILHQIHENLKAAKEIKKTIQEIREEETFHEIIGLEQRYSQLIHQKEKNSPLTFPTVPKEPPSLNNIR